MIRHSFCRQVAATIALVLAATITVAYGIPGYAQPALEASYPPADFAGRIALSPDHGPVGTLVRITGSGFPANAVMDVSWVTVKGAWVLKGAAREEFHGRRFDLAVLRLTQATTDAQGRIEAQFRVPDDYGFTHDVLLLQDGVIRNKAGFNLDIQVKVSPRSGPAGTPITIDVRGIGWQAMENSWMVIYDNRFTGWLSSVTTQGRARAIIPATGGVGRHLIQIVHGSFTFPYMNMQQSPRPERPTFAFAFTVTPGPPILPSKAERQALPLQRGAAPAGSGPAIWPDIALGTVGTAFRLMGRGLPAGETLDVTWGTVVGNRVSGDGWDDETEVIAQAVADASGSIALPLKARDGVGGSHPITARLAGKILAQTSFVLGPSAFALTPSSGPAGTAFTIHLKGVGWTETANIYHIVYDNAYLGYACGFNSQGDVQVFLKATGEPGWHYIDLYPGIYRGRDAGGVNNFRIPQLTYAADHPGERLPAFRFAFLVTK